MFHKLFAVTIIAVLLSVALAAVSVQRYFLRRGNQKLVDATVDTSRRQAAKSIYRETPFYFPFKAASTRLTA
jgi:hypothetical protein